jgi:RNA polymerase sigma-70 factor (ECF subfamily)
MVHGSPDNSQTGQRGGSAMSKQNENEAAMIAAILAGDTQLYHELIRPHERSVYMMALSFMKNEADAEEIAQEAFLKAFRSLSRFRADSKFGTWLISITLNEARSRLRRQAIVRMESLDDPPEERGSVSPALLRDWREIPSETLERQEVRQMLREAVISLPEIYLQVFQLRDIEELSINETAEALGITVGSVKVRLHRARMMLQKQLTPLLKSVSSSPKRRWFPWS